MYRAVREVDDVEQAEDDGRAQREQGVERAIDETDEQLAHGPGSGAEAEDFVMVSMPCGPARPSGLFWSPAGSRLRSGTEGLVGRDGLHQLVVVPRSP